MYIPEPGAEEGGEDIFAMPKECIRYDCARAPLVNKGAFRVCSRCGSSYGARSASGRAPDGRYLTSSADLS